jgi:CHRD domain
MRPMRTLLALGLVAVLALLVAAPAFGADGGRPLSTTLTGAEEAPGPGDPDGTGFAALTVNPGLGEVCVFLEVSGVDPIAAAHIHKAPAGVPGPVVVPLVPPTSGQSMSCESITRELALALIQHPSDYYVNVHNDAFQAGALRGQLGD